MENAGITTNHRIAAFLANIGVESAQLMVTQENANYSAQGLRKVFPKYFPTDEMAEQYAHHPEAILNRVYANRMGNSYEETGEGYFYRGRGLIQLTGKNNYITASKLMGVNIFANAELLCTPTYSVLSATTFWASRNLNNIVDTQDFVKVCETINGGRIGLQERTNLYNHIVGVIGV